MRLDPAAWTISLVGCFYDWLMTRKWKQVFLGLIPLLILLITLGLVVRGQTLDKDRLANWYLQLGEKEIEGWEKQWAPEAQIAPSSDSSEPDPKPDGSEPNSTDERKADEQAPADEKSVDSESSPTANSNAEQASSATQKPEDTQLSPFAMAIFRRVLQLQAGDQRAQWIVGMIMAQRGSLTQAKERMKRIAPDDREGYLPAHAWMAQYYMQQGVNNENLQTVMHHLASAFKGSRVPLPVLLAGSQLLWKIDQRDDAIKALERAAQADPQYTLRLAQYARIASKARSEPQPPQQQLQSVPSLGVAQLDRIAERAEQNAVAIFSAKLQRDPRDSQTRLLLAEAYVNQRKLSEAEVLLREGLLLKETPQLKRGLSEVWRLRFVVSRSAADGKLTADIEALEKALRIDPSNPLIAQEVAQLARLGGDRPSKELLDQLQQFLVEGKATAATHAWIAEHHLIVGEYNKSIPHLEQVVNRLPDAADYLNNLAYVLAKVAPKRLEDAIGFSRRATKLDPNRADFHDTQGTVLMTMGKAAEALTAFEEAIRLESGRADFHTRAAEAYSKIGDQVMADRHQKMAEILVKESEASPNPALPQIPYALEPKGGQIQPNNK